jgi:tetratricopeptide (TPR) repeat protein
MAAATSASNVQQWDTRTRKRFGPAMVYPEPAQVIRYSPDGKRLAVAYLDDSVRLWDADTGWPLGPPLVHTSPPVQLAFSDNNRTLLSITEAGIVRTWPVPYPVQDDAHRFEVWMQARAGLRLEDDEPVQLSIEEWKDACRKLQKHWPKADPALSEVSDDLAPWHRVRARDAEEVGNERGEQYHLTRLAALRPAELALHARIARIHARVAFRLPEGSQRDGELKLAWAAVKRGLGSPIADHWANLGVVEAVARKSTDEALWYLDRLAPRGDWSLFAERGDLHGQRGDRARRDADLEQALVMGGIRDRAFALKAADAWAREDRWSQTARTLSAAMEHGPTSPDLLRPLALAQVKAGNRVGHANLCQAVLRGLPPNIDVLVAVEAARICSLSPEAVESWRRPLALTASALVTVDQALARASGDQKKFLEGLRREWLTTLGASLHRAGQHAQAIERLNEAMKLAPGGEGGPVEWAWLALAHAATEKSPTRQARRWLERARTANRDRDGARFWEAVQVEVIVAETLRVLRTKDEF